MRSELNFRRRIALAQSDYWAYKSTDLETWESVPVPGEAVPDAMPGFERVTVAFQTLATRSDILPVEVCASIRFIR